VVGLAASFIVKVTSPKFKLKDDFTSLNIPESLVEHVCTTMLPFTFQSFYKRGYKGQEDKLLTALRNVAADPRQCSSGWLVHFSLEQMALVVDIVQPHGQLPWEDLTNPLWTELLSHAEEAWLALDSGFMYPDEERLPLACLPGAVSCPPVPLRWIALTLP